MSMATSPRQHAPTHRAGVVYYTTSRMGAVLVGTDGPSRGRLVLLGEAEVSVGRDEGNSVAIDDLAASRRHFIIRSVGERFQLRDLDSRNGTLVNGVLVQERLLEDNDEIRVGGSVFLFKRSATEASSQVGKPHEPQPAGVTTILRSGDSIYLNPKKVDERLIPSDRTAQGIHVLLQISQALQGAQTLEMLQRQLLELLLGSVPADRAAILLTSAGESTFGLERGSGDAQPVEIPGALVGQILEQRGAVLTDRVGPGGLESSRLLGVPLMCFERVEGVLYLEAGAEAFDSAHLELVAAVGSVAGLALHNLLRVDNLRSENQRLEAEIRVEHDMVGDSEPMRAIHQFIARVAGAGSTVLINGESGTGKELVARAIHRTSPRASRPFVAINCAALTESLLESELFGHERGAFTGAVGLKKGKFEIADGGTLFLDEVGELAPALQAKLLRALQHQEFERVGGTRPVRADVRIIAATNRDLDAAVRNNTFRQDLFFRLNVIGMVMPPLRDRPDDIPPLAAYFTRKFSEKVKRKVTGISEKARAALLRYDWPGNVRELENAIERAVVLGATDLILQEDLPEAVLESAVAAPFSAGNYQDAVVEAKRRVVRDALERAHGVYTDAARLLDIHPNYLHRLVRALGLR
jgi:transcriptional regulator with GAF, ATPase, and Fis domain